MHLLATIRRMSTPSPIPTYTVMRSGARAGVVVFLVLGCLSLLMSLLDVTASYGDNCDAALFNPDEVDGTCAASVAAAAQAGTAAAVAGLAFMVAAAVFAILGRRLTSAVPASAMAPLAPTPQAAPVQPMPPQAAAPQPGQPTSGPAYPYGQQFSPPPGS